MCPDNLTEFSRQAENKPENQALLYTKFSQALPVSRQDGIRTVQVYQVTGKKANKTIREIRRKILENKENIPPLVRQEASLSQTEYVTKGSDQCYLSQKEGHDVGEHSGSPN